MIKIKQINNLKIFHSPAVLMRSFYGTFAECPEKFYIVAPDGRRLEEFATLEAAENYAKDIKDFIVKK